MTACPRCEGELQLIREEVKRSTYYSTLWCGQCVCWIENRIDGDKWTTEFCDIRGKKWLLEK